jgi:hypothetical protein
MIGSCFSQNIGIRLQNYKFNCIANPFGTIFHPLAIAKILSRASNLDYIDPSSLMHSQGIWVHPDFHSSLGHTDATQAHTQINQTLERVHDLLKSADFLFITLGTMIGYQMIDTNEIVANCHKLPASQFTKTESTLEECFSILDPLFVQLWDNNPDLNIVLTVSPVRHIKDGIIKNSRSKAKLIMLCDQLVNSHPKVSYFPAYEWMVDDLRDYRFYEKDLIHPNEQAIDYIWEKFGAVYFEPKTTDLLQKIEKINRAKQHKPFNPESIEHQMFISKLHEDINALESKYEWLKL